MKKEISKIKLTDAYVRKLVAGENKIIWDSEMKQFGVHIYKSRVSYFINYRNKYGKQTRYTIGATSAMSLKQAKAEAQSLFTEIRKGEDPLQTRKWNKNLKTVAELCDLYLKEGCANKKQSTIQMDKSRIHCHILPLIGNLPVAAITRATVKQLMNDIINGKTAKDRHKTAQLRGTSRVSGGKGAAARTIGMFGAIMKFAVDMGIIETNPCEGIERPQDEIRDTYMTLEELQKLGQEMRSCTTTPPSILKAIHLVLLTGCRKNEVQQLKWSEVDLQNQCFRFHDTKTGRQMRPFGIAAKHLLESIPQSEEYEWVFPSRIDNKHITDSLSYLKELTKRAGINKNITVHTIRHTFATLCDCEDWFVASLLGHSRKTTTSRYRHNPNPSPAVLSVADEISSKIEKALTALPVKQHSVDVS